MERASWVLGWEVCEECSSHEGPVKDRGPTKASNAKKST
jgi:hypothetical protein